MNATPSPSTPATTPATPEKTMNAPTSPTARSTVATSRHADPTTYAPPTSPGIVGVLVLFGPPAVKPTPARMRDAFGDAIDRSPGADTCFVVDSAGAPVLVDGQKIIASAAFLGGLPESISPVAAIGLAVNGAVEPGAQWVQNGRAKGASCWTYCASTVTSRAVDIHGTGTTAEVTADGTLTIAHGVPPVVADRLRAAYDTARGVVEPSRVSAIVAAFLAKQGGQYVTSSSYLLPTVSPLTCGVLAGLADLGGFAVTYSVADPAQIQALATPVQRSVEEQIAAVTASAAAFIAKAREVAAPSSDASIQGRSIETVRAQIETARNAAEMWRSRLKLASLDVGEALATLDTDAENAGKLAIAAMAKRREDAKLRREVNGLQAL